jgi:acyl-CoA synthetase (AMP-forming)/AMP-acid ligase II
MAASAQTIGELFIRQAVEQVNLPYLILPESGETLTFSKAADSAAGVEKILILHGFVVGDRVALILPNGKESALTLLAVMSAGGVAVPLNPRLTSARHCSNLPHALSSAILHNVMNLILFMPVFTWQPAT